MLERRVDELLHLGECHNLIKFAFCLTLAHAKNSPAQENVLAARELGMETRADLEQAADAPMNLGEADGRACDPREYLEQGGFAGAIAANQADDLAFLVALTPLSKKAVPPCESMWVRHTEVPR